MCVAAVQLKPPSRTLPAACAVRLPILAWTETEAAAEQQVNSDDNGGDEEGGEGTDWEGNEGQQHQEEQEEYTEPEEELLSLSGAYRMMVKSGICATRVMPVLLCHGVPCCCMSRCDVGCCAAAESSWVGFKSSVCFTAHTPPRHSL